tara:strand:- start:1021 stop:1320 length:300 start_codon:yes stop_codon:yes gene_type:complete
MDKEVKMKEVKLKNGKKVKLKELSLDDRDFLLDNTQYVMDKGEIQEVKMMHSTLTKYLRTGIDGDTSDKTLMKMSFEDRVEIFKAIQGNMLLGEENPSS